MSVRALLQEDGAWTFVGKVEELMMPSGQHVERGRVDGNASKSGFAWLFFLIVGIWPNLHGYPGASSVALQVHG